MLLSSFRDSVTVVNNDEATQINIDALKGINRKAIQDIEIFCFKL